MGLPRHRETGAAQRAGPHAEGVHNGRLLRHGRLPSALAAGVLASWSMLPVTGAAGQSSPSPRPSLAVTVNGVAVPDAATNLPGSYDFSFRTYTLCCPGGSPTQRTVPYGWTMATLITAAGADVSRTQVVTVTRPPAQGGGVVTLLPPDFNPASPGGLDFPEGPAPIYVYGFGTAQVFDFLRPYRQPPPADQNYPDWIQTPPGGTLTIAITAGRGLGVQATANPTDPVAGANVVLQATASNALPGEQLSYTWHLTDGSDLSGAQVQHAFAVSGTYQAVASVSGSEGSGGSSQPITITVGSTPAPPGPGQTQPTDPPVQGGPAPAPPASGSTATPVSTADPGTTAGQSAQAPAPPRGSAPPGPTPGGPAKAPPGTTLGAPTPPATASVGPVAAPPAPPAAPAPTAPPGPPAVAGAVDVRGVLLGSGPTLPSGSVLDPGVGKVAAAAMATGPHGARPPRGAGLDATEWSALGALGLFLLGAGLDRRSTPGQVAGRGRRR